jgi:uncharacterized protein
MKCPICKKPVEWQANVYRPFCSERCQLIDLGNWANEKYGLPFESDPASDEKESQIDQD